MVKHPINHVIEAARYLVCCINKFSATFTKPHKNRQKGTFLKSPFPPKRASPQGSLFLVSVSSHSSLCFISLCGCATLVLMITAYIDESGNLGRGGKYFVLAAVVFDTPNGDKRIKRIIKKECLRVAQESYNVPLQELKSSLLSFQQRQRILGKITARADVDFFYIVFDKPHVTLLQTQKPKNLVYNYFAKLLTDLIFAKYNDSFRIVFDQRSTCVHSMNSLPDYIKISAFIDHPNINQNIEVFQHDSRTMYNLQAADLLAGTVYQAYCRQKRHFLRLIEDRVVKKSEFPGNFEGSLA